MTHSESSSMETNHLHVNLEHVNKAEIFASYSEYPDYKLKYIENISFFKSKLRIFLFLDHPSSTYAKVFHSIMFFLTLICFVLSIISVVPALLNRTLNLASAAFNFVLISEYSIEFLLRLWSCEVFDKYRGWRILLYISSSYMVIDMVIIATTLPILMAIFNPLLVNDEAVTFLKFVQVMRFFRYERYHGSVRMMTKVLYVHRNELLTGYCSALMLIFFTTFIIYLAERNGGHIKTVTDSFYFTTISFLTIGYGDVVPSGLASRFIIIVTALLGVALAAVPSGIIGSGFALQVASKNKRKKKKEIAKPTVILLQRAFRSYFYMSRDTSYIQRLDMTNSTNSSKFKYLFQRDTLNMTKNSQMGTVEKETPYMLMNDSILSSEPTKSLPQSSANNKLPISAIFNRFKIYKKSPTVNPSDIDEETKALIKMCGNFIRYVLLIVAAKKFKLLKSPISVEEMIEIIENNQKKMNYHIEEIHTSIKTIKQKQKSLTSLSENPICHECSNVKNQITELNNKISSVEDKIVQLINLVSK